MLLRLHRSIASEPIFDLAVRVATDTADLETLDRLAKGASRVGNEELRTRISAARALAAKPRALGTVDKLDTSAFSPLGLQVVEAVMQTIRFARVTADAAAFNDIGKALEDSQVITDQQREQLKKVLAEARADLPSEPAPGLAEWAKLTAASRTDRPVPGSLTIVITGGNAAPPSTKNISAITNNSGSTIPISGSVNTALAPGGSIGVRPQPGRTPMATTYQVVLRSADFSNQRGASSFIIYGGAYQRVRVPIASMPLYQIGFGLAAGGGVPRRVNVKTSGILTVR